MPNISAIIINWNTRRILLDCLASVYRTASDLMGEVWVVDNGSSDGSFHAVQRIYPQARLICNRENRGFSQACNQALKVITGRYALLLNTDVVLQNEAVERLRDFLEANPKVAMAGGQLLHEDGRKQNSFAPFPSLLTELTHKGLLRFLFPQKFSTRTSNGYGFQEAEFLAPRSSVDSLVGACMLVRMEALRQVGLLDEDYFFFLEETDWCYRFRKAGWAIGYVPQARIIHLQGQTAKAHPARARIEYCRSRYLFFRKHRGRTKSAVLQGGLFLRFTLDLFFMTLLNLLTLFSLPHCREKLGIYGQIVHWHLQGCPEEMGLKECKKENAKGKDPRYPFIETQENPKSAGKPKGRLADWPRVEMGGIRWRVRLDCFDRLSPLLRNNQLPHGCRMVKTNRVREVTVIALSANPGDRRIYLKTHRIPRRRDRLASLWLLSKAHKEAEIALTLREKGIPTVSPLAIGEKRKGWRVEKSYLVMEEIQEASPLGDVYQEELMGKSNRDTRRHKRELTFLLAQLVGQIHREGIHHNDFHAGNFLIRREEGRDELFLVDLHSIRLRRKLTTTQRLASLVQLNIFFLERLNAAGRLRFLRDYTRENPNFKRNFKMHARLIEKRSLRSRQRLFERRDRRCLRENGDFLPFDSRGYRGYLRQEAAGKDGLEGYLREPHLLWEQPTLESIKESRTFSVARLPFFFDERPGGIFIKRSFSSGPWKVLKELLRGSRSFRSWKSAHSLLARGFRTPLPLGAAGRKVGTFAREDFFVTREVPNVLGIDWFVPQELGPQSPVEGRRKRRRTFVRQFSQMIRRLHALGIYHPDLKGSNILVGTHSRQEGSPEHEFFIVDLEGVKVGRRLGRRQQIKNLSQINTSFIDTAVISRTDRLRFFKAYLGPQGLPKDHKLPTASKTLWRQVLRESRKRLERAGRCFT